MSYPVERSASDDGDADLPKSVTVAFKVLEAVAADPGQGVSALARRTGIAKSTVQRALRTLEALDYVYSSGEVTRWSLTLRAYSLGARAPVMDVAQASLGEMRVLSGQTNESIQLTTLEGATVVVIEKVDSTLAVRSYVGRGEHLPAHVSASGKALLAAIPHVLEDLLRNPLQRFTDATIIDPDHFRREMRRIDKLGYAINFGEYRADVSAVGAVVRGPSGEAIAGLGISAPKHRAPVKRLHDLAPVLLETTRRISNNLGSPPPRVEPEHARRAATDADR